MGRRKSLSRSPTSTPFTAKTGSLQKILAQIDRPPKTYSEEELSRLSDDLNIKYGPTIMGKMLEVQLQAKQFAMVQPPDAADVGQTPLLRQAARRSNTLPLLQPGNQPMEVLHLLPINSNGPESIELVDLELGTELHNSEMDQKEEGSPINFLRSSVPEHGEVLRITYGVEEGGIPKDSNLNSAPSRPPPECTTNVQQKQLEKQSAQGNLGSTYVADRISTTSEVPLLTYVAVEGKILASPKAATAPTPTHNHNKASEQQHSASSYISSSWAVRVRKIKSVGSTPLQFIHPKSEQGNAIELEEEEFEEEIEKSKRFLVGYFIGRMLPLHLVRGHLSSQWSLKGSVEIQPRGDKCFYFNFSNHEDKAWVLENSDTHVANHLFIIREWAVNVEFQAEEMTTIPIWVNVKGMPDYMCNSSGYSRIGSKIGKPLFSDKSTYLNLNPGCARLCNEITPSSSLPTTIFVSKVSTESARIQVSYPWKPPRCPTCKTFNHSLSNCHIKVTVPTSVASTSTNHAHNQDAPPDGFTAVQKECRKQPYLRLRT